MNYAIEMFFDKKAEDSIRTIWCKLHESKLSSYMNDSGSIPHISLTVFNQLNIEHCTKLLLEFSRSEHCIDVLFCSIGSFPTDEGVLFLSPVVTDRLLSLHHSFHTMFSDFKMDQWEYYLPNNWVPHATLGFIKEKATFSIALHKVIENFSLIHAKIISVGIVEYPSVNVISRFEFLDSE